MDSSPQSSPMASPQARGSPMSLIGSPKSPHTRNRSPQSHLISTSRLSPLKSPPPLQMELDDELMDQPVDNPPKPRLVIRKLVLINYKSYAGRQEIGPFNDNFTAIVGPNGSGKSNVIDSLLFVFGFRAKKMRQSKLTGLIHNSEHQPNLAFARVEVHFETLGVADSDLVLAREVRRDGNNFYLMNNRRCNYAEVSQLLGDRGIDLRHKRFLILQGEVESIALMPPKAENDGEDGLLEYLEDIIGTANYKSRIEELEAESLVLKQNCSEKQRRVDIVNKDLKKLDSDRVIIEKYLLNKNKVVRAKSSLYQLLSFKLQNAKELSSVAIDENVALHSSVQDGISEKSNLLAELDRKSNSRNPELISMKNELKNTSAELKEANVRQAKVKQQRQQLAKRLKKAERGLSDSKSEKIQADLWLENFSSDDIRLKEKLKGVVQAGAEERMKLEQIQSELHESTKDLHDELQELQSQAEPWREQILSKLSEMKSVDTELSGIRSQLELVTKQERECSEQATLMSEEGVSKKKEIKRLENNHNQLVEEQAQVINEIKTVTQKHAYTLQELKDLRADVSAAQQTRSSSQTRDMIEKRLMDLKIKGLYGRLGSLGSIDQKYDVAVSTAGGELNNFVVDTVETARTCLQMLRKHSIGRAKFVVLDVLPDFKQASSGQFPAQRLIDLVKPVDPIFKKAFYSALGNCLVVDTPDEARKVAFGKTRHKVVALNGTLINTSGVMSGGGAPRKGLMAKHASSLLPEELERKEKQLASLEFDDAEIRQKLTKAQARATELEAQIPRLKLELDKAHMSRTALLSQFEIIKEKRRSLREELQSEKIKEIAVSNACTAKKAQLEKERNALENESTSIEQAIQSLQDKILEAGGLRLREQSSRVSDLQKEEVDIQRQIEDGQRKLAQQISLSKKLANEILGHEKTISECGKNDVSETDNSDIAKLEATIQRLSVQIDNLVNEQESSKLEANGLKAEIDTLRGSEIEYRNSLEKLKQARKEKENRITELQQKLSNLSLVDVSIAKSLDDPTTETIKDEPMTDAKFDYDILDLPELTPDEINDLNEAELREEVAACQKTIEGSTPDFDVLETYRGKHSEYTERKAIGDKALADYESVRNEAQELKKCRHTEFMAGFLQISAKLKEMYQLITMGGNAELELVDTMDPFAEGILFSVMPPKKSWRNLSNLSGGEKTLSSLALVFALHHYKPTPLYVMDEIDAALDFRNVSIIANYIKERTKDAQFVVISLRNNMFELASRLVGVYKVNNMTQSVTLQIE